MAEDKPWFAKDAVTGANDARLHAPATARNREAIAAILAQELPERGLVLEIASGSGEHALAFAAQFPRLNWQPSDPSEEARASIAAWMAEERLPNLRRPLDIDATAPDWPVATADALLCINMAHISPWEASCGLFAGAARVLPVGAPMVLYGPFFRRDVEPEPSNIAFDRQLRARDAAYGIRQVEDMDAQAARHGLHRSALHRMPAHNLMLVYRVRNQTTGD